MAIRPIVKWGEGVLHEPSALVPEVTDEIRKLLDDMHETMIAAPGIGLAAPQIGVPLRVIIVDLSVGKDPAQLIELINPEFISREGEVKDEEGCLSVPGYVGSPVRPKFVRVKGLARDGSERVHEGEGLLAVAFCHEIDHIEGKLFVDRLTPLKRDLMVRKLRKRHKYNDWDE
ncbi:MAG: peptide deformylase [Vicinamibacteria bacterium]